MSDIVGLINRLDTAGIQLGLKDGRLTTRAAGGAITDELAAAIRSRRDELVAFLKRHARATTGPGPVTARDASTHALSFAQKRLWLIDRVGTAGASYAMPVALRLRGALDRDAVAHALETIVARHEVLRTVYAEEASMPCCRVLPPGTFAMGDEAIGEDLLRERMDGMLAEPFDLAHGPIVRATLFRLGSEEHALLFNVHHIASDGWSTGILVREFAALYAARVLGGPVDLPPLDVQYGDYAAWQAEWAATGGLAADLDYWSDRLRGIPHLHGLPTDRPRPAKQRFDGAVHVAGLERGLAAALAGLCVEEGATPFIALQLAFALLLSRWSHEDDIVFGTPVANRTRPELEGLLGFFVNTLVLRNRIDPAQSFRAALREATARMARDYDHQGVPFDLLVETLNPERSAAHPPLCQVMFALQNAPSGTMRLPGVELSSIVLSQHTAKFDLTLSLVEKDGGMTASWEYSTDLFDAATIERMAGHYATLLGEIVAAPDAPMAAHAMIDAGERRRLLHDANDTRRAYPASDIPAEFRRQAAMHADRIAVADGASSLTYAQLDARVERLAAYLCARGVGDEELVGIYVDRGIDMIVCMLAILRAGGAYVPMDLSMPAARVGIVARDAGCRTILCSSARQAALAGLDGECVAVDLLDLETPLPPAPALRGGRERLAYVMYTSGSTGQPKGVMIEQRGILRLVCGTDYMHIEPHDVVAQSSNSAFDASTYEVWAALLNGATLDVVDAETLVVPEHLADAIARRGITVLWLTTSLFNQTVNVAPGMFGGLTWLFFGGEAAEPSAVNRVVEAGKPRHLVNIYGPTENTAYTTAFEVREVLVNGCPIGRPIGNTTCHVLGRGGELLPWGAVGELHAGGDGVARGYLHRDELTRERFLADPFAGREGARLYRTGDIARWLPDGNLQYLGRADQQVKIRGFRIEPGEIEHALMALPGIEEAGVVTVDDPRRGMQLAAYVVLGDAGRNAAGTEPARRAWLRGMLAEALPPYMVPAAIVFMAALPLNANGKLDRRVLPAPTFGDEGAFAPPEGPVETALAAIWRDVLGASRIGRHDHFFERGGHSLLAVQVLSRMRSTLGVEVGLHDVFAHPTLAALATVAQHAGANTRPALRRQARTEAVPVSWAQQRLWFLDQLDPAASRAYHMPLALRLRGELDVGTLRRALDRIVARHENLRTVFVAREGLPHQVVAADDAGIAWRLHDLRGLPSAVQDDELARHVREERKGGFDLARGPLIRARVVVMGDDDHALLVTMHHIVSDGWSLGVLLRELTTLYAAFAGGGADPLPPLAVQYADYALWQRQWLAGDTLEAQAAYWKARLDGAPTLTTFPGDRPRPPAQSYAGDRLSFTLAPELTAALHALSRRHDTTLFMTLLAGWTVLLARYAGQRDLVIGTPVANRTHVDVEPLVGFFVNTLALRVSLEDDPTVAGLLERVRAVTLGAQANQDLPFEQVVEAARPERSLAHGPLFQTTFAFDNTPDGSGTLLPGIVAAPLGSGHRVTQFDASLSLSESGGALSGGIEFATDLYDRDTVQGWIDSLRQVFDGMDRDPAATVSRLPILDAAGIARIEAFAGTVAPLPGPMLIHRRFEAQAAAHRDRVAIEQGGRRMSYAGLNEEANRLAHVLRAAGVGAETRVALHARRSPEMLVGMLATLKAGAAYVPLDPDYPASRLAHMLRDSAPAALLGEGGMPVELLRSLPAGATVIDLGADAASWRAASAANLVDDDPDASRLAYVIYTTGSTGTPKGVMVEHGAVVNQLAAFAASLDLGSGTRVLQFAALSFDTAVEEILGSLTHGATLVLRDDAWLADAETFWALCDAQRIDIVDLPTQFWTQLALEGVPPPACVRAVVIGGEAVGEGALRAWFVHSAPPRLVNTYGPTEATVSVCQHVADGTPGDWRRIGRAHPNVRLRVLDEHGQPVPVGVAGELHIGGVQLARGYLNLPAPTAERFAGTGAARTYRTGDMVRWLKDGCLEYLGRNDDQVKIRGFRIEPGEIDTVMARLEGIGDVMTTALGEDGSERRLVTYYLADEALAPDDLHRHAAQALPPYMRPAAFVRLDAWPLTPSGKVDRKALPLPGAASLPSTGFVPPEGDIEHGLAHIWADLLGVARIGRDDHFFQLGGHSLLAVRLVTRVRKELAAELALAAVFTHPTLRSLAATLHPAPSQPVAEPAGKLPDRRAIHVDTSTGRKGAVPLFVLPGLFANTRETHALAEALRGDRQVTRYVCHTLTEHRWGSADMRELGAMYARHIAGAADGGPVALLGWSIGGDLAFLAARELRDRCEVRFVGLVDVHRPVPAAWKGDVRHDGADDAMARFAGSAMEARWTQLFASLDADSRRAALAFVEREAIRPDERGADMDAPEYRAWARLHHEAAMRTLQWQRSDLPLYVWRAAHSVAGGSLRDWSRLGDVRHDTTVADCDHRGILDQPRWIDDVRNRLMALDAVVPAHATELPEKACS
jgi:amino acid adenylation domain-containing protein